MVGKVAVKAPTLIMRWAYLGRDYAVLAVVASDGQLNGCFSMVGVVFKVASAGNHSVCAERPIVPLDRRCRALDVELGTANCAHFTLAESSLSAVGPLHPQRQLINVRRVMPDPSVCGAQDPTRSAAVKLVDPIDVVRTPVVNGATRNGVLLMPGPARMFEPAHEGLDI